MLFQEFAPLLGIFELEQELLEQQQLEQELGQKQQLGKQHLLVGSNSWGSGSSSSWGSSCSCLGSLVSSCSQPVSILAS